MQAFHEYWWDAAAPQISSPDGQPNSLSSAEQFIFILYHKSYFSLPCTAQFVTFICLLGDECIQNQPRMLDIVSVLTEAE